MQESRESSYHYGKAIEAQAEAWLERRYAGRARLVARGFRCKQGELDLVFELQEARGIELVFVEVRARGEGAWVDGLESVGPVKRRRLARTISVFLARYRGRARSARVDIVAWNGREWRHVVNVRLD